MSISTGKSMAIRCAAVACAATLGMTMMFAGASGGSGAAPVTGNATAVDRSGNSDQAAPVDAAPAEAAPAGTATASDAGAALGVRAARNKPEFAVPFECGEVWRGATYSYHSPWSGIDFNHSPDFGWKVTASASGTVRTVRNLGNTSYGRYIVISHRGGYTTYYAHLSGARVHEGQHVKVGQVIGRVGNSGGSHGSHLHYEQRHHGSYVKASFYGHRATYWGHANYKVRCKGGNPDVGGGNDGGNNGGSHNPYNLREICGSSYSKIDSHRIKGATIVLAYSSSTGKNCITTIKHSSIGKKSKVSAWVRTKGKKVSDSGHFSFYAGPKKLYAKGTCVRWGGSMNGKSWSSKYEHCGA